MIFLPRVPSSLVTRSSIPRGLPIGRVTRFVRNRAADLLPECSRYPPIWKSRRSIAAPPVPPRLPTRPATLGRAPSAALMSLPNVPPISVSLPELLQAIAVACPKFFRGIRLG